MLAGWQPIFWQTNSSPSARLHIGDNCMGKRRLGWASQIFGVQPNNSQNSWARQCFGKASFDSKPNTPYILKNFSNTEKRKVVFNNKNMIIEARRYDCYSLFLSDNDQCLIPSHMSTSSQANFTKIIEDQKDNRTSNLQTIKACNMIQKSVCEQLIFQNKEVLLSKL